MKQRSGEDSSLIPRFPDSPVRFAFVFPGQGSQYVGMGKEVWDRFQIAKDTFKEASDILKKDIAKLCFEGPESELNLTENTQPAILTASIAIWKVLAAENTILPSCVAGHSLGEYTALVVSGALDFKDAVRIVNLRGKFMQEAVPEGIGAMAAVLGLKGDIVKDICKEASTDNSVAVAANFNSPEQTVISGNKAAVLKASSLAKERGAKRVIPLPVSVPSHSPLMQPAAKKLEQELKKINFKDLNIPVVTNVDAEPITSSDKARELLVKQLYSPVRWVESIAKMKGLGVEKIIEIGPGKVLTGLIKRIDSDIETMNVEKAEDIKLVAAGFMPAQITHP
ncbi:MAG: ACP S-malonyltransferase [Deltaproteobacteria bacterium]|nr:ACP S-malonyltransferase [Deltaproteobacteria bacterium]